MFNNILNTHNFISTPLFYYAYQLYIFKYEFTVINIFYYFQYIFEYFKQHKIKSYIFINY